MFSESTYYSGWKSDERYNLWKSLKMLMYQLSWNTQSDFQIFFHFRALQILQALLTWSLTRKIFDKVCKGWNIFWAKICNILQFKDVFISKIVLSYYLVLFEFSTVEVTGPLNLKIVSKFFQIILQEGVKYKARNEEVTNWFWRGKVSM